jgi:hypothetical protein
MNQANPKDLPDERLFHYLEMATKAHEAGRSPNTDVRIRNLYVWFAKTWEMLAMDELDNLRHIKLAEPRKRLHQSHAPRTPSRGNSHGQ